jgi:hypothetical protein
LTETEIVADDLPSLVEGLSRERLAAYAHHVLSGTLPPAPVLRELRDRLRPLRHATAAKAMSSERLLEQALDALNAGSVPVMPLKGTELAALLYSAPELRDVSDIDLWVEPSRLDHALAVLTEAGWRHQHTDPAIQAYHRRDGYAWPLLDAEHGFLLELHHRLHPDLPPDAQARIWEGAGRGQLLGRDCLRPDPSARFIFLCSHLVQSGLVGASKWLLDLVLLMRSETFAPDWSRVATLAADWDQAFALVIVDAALRTRWGLGLPEEMLADLGAQLRRPERRVVDDVRRGARPDAVRLIRARRLAGRRTWPRPVWSVIWPHPGVVCLEMGVSSGTPWFACHRLRHIWRRVRRIAGRS